MNRLVSRFLIAVVSVASLSLSALAVSQGDFSWEGYARSNVQIGNKGQGSQVLWTGFGLHPRLQEGQYIESVMTAKLPMQSKFVLNLAHGGDPFTYTDAFGTDHTAIRELYLSMDGIGGVSGLSAWFGDKLYRGDCIGLFDSWVFDDQNLYGGGLKWNIGKFSAELAMGTKKGTGYVDFTTNTVADIDASQRQMYINKLVWNMTPKQYFKTNAEIHHVSKTDAMINGGQYKLPGADGYRVGLEYSLTNKFGQNFVFGTYGKGDIVTGNYFFSTPASYSTIVLMSTTGANVPVTLSTKRGAIAKAMGIGGDQDFGWAGVSYGLVTYVIQDRNGVRGRQCAGAIRSLYYLTKRMNVGAEVDRIEYPKKKNADDLNYTQIAPMIEYTLKGGWTNPKFRLIYAETYYQKAVVRNGKNSRQAYNISLGMELGW